VTQLLGWMVCRLFNKRALTAKAIYKKVYPTNKKNLNMAVKPTNTHVNMHLLVQVLK